MTEINVSEIVNNLRLLWADVRAEDGNRLVDAEYIDDCKNVVDSLVRTGLIADDSGSFTVTILGELFIAATRGELPWLSEFVQGIMVWGWAGEVR
jgi:hypothetical protein